jgi:hypothetical protein
MFRAVGRRETGARNGAGDYAVPLSKSAAAGRMSGARHGGCFGARAEGRRDSKQSPGGSSRYFECPYAHSPEAILTRNTKLTFTNSSTLS